MLHLHLLMVSHLPNIIILNGTVRGGMGVTITQVLAHL